MKTSKKGKIYHSKLDVHRTSMTPGFDRVQASLDALELLLIKQHAKNQIVYMKMLNLLVRQQRLEDQLAGR